MDHIKTFRKINGVDAGYHDSVIHPANREGCVGARGIDKHYTREQVFELAHRMTPSQISLSGPDLTQNGISRSFLSSLWLPKYKNKPGATLLGVPCMSLNGNKYRVGIDTL